MKDIRCIKTITKSDNKFYVMWALTTWCNYRCPYCFQDPAHDKWVDENILVDRAKKINNWLISNNKNVESISLLGGEITYYNLENILNRFTVNLKEIVITTNFSQKLDYFKNLYIYCSKRNSYLTLICSYHENEDIFFNKYLELVKWCAEYDYPIPTVTFVVDNDFDFSIFDRYKEIPFKKINFNLRQIGDKLVVLNDEVKAKLKYITDNKHAWSNNKLIKARLEKNKQNNITAQKKKIYEINYFDGTKEEYGNLKDVLYQTPKLLVAAPRYCTAAINNCFIDTEGNISICSSNPKFIGNIDIITETKIKNTDILTCDRPTCPVCHDVNIYSNLKDLLADNHIESEEDTNEL